MIITEQQFHHVKNLDKRGDYKNIAAWSQKFLAENKHLEITNKTTSDTLLLCCWALLRTKSKINIPKFLSKIFEFYKYFGDAEGVSDSLNALGYFYQRKGDYDKSISCFKTSIEQDTPDYSSSRVRAYYYLTLPLASKKQYEESLEILNNIKLQVYALEDNNLISCLHNQYFTAYYGLGKEFEGEADLRTSLSFLENSSNYLYSATAENSLACFYERKGEIDGALYHVQRAIRFAQKAECKDFEARFFDTLAQIQLTAGKPYAALNATKASISLLIGSGDYGSLVESYLTNCRVLTELSRDNEAFNSFARASDLRNKYLGGDDANTFSDLRYELLNKTKRKKSISVGAKAEICTSGKQLVELPPGIKNSENLSIGKIQTNKLEHYGLPEGTKVLIEKSNEIPTGVLGVVKEKDKRNYHFGFVSYYPELRLYDIDFRNGGEREPLLFGSEEVDYIGRIVAFCPRDEISSVVRMKPLEFSV